MKLVTLFNRSALSFPILRSLGDVCDCIPCFVLLPLLGDQLRLPRSVTL